MSDLQDPEKMVADVRGSGKRDITEKFGGGVTFRAYHDLKLLVQYNDKSVLDFPAWVRKKSLMESMPESAFGCNYLVDLRNVRTEFSDQDIDAITKIDKDVNNRSTTVEDRATVLTSVLVSENDEPVWLGLCEKLNAAYHGDFVHAFRELSDALSWLGFADLDPKDIDL